MKFEFRIFLLIFIESPTCRIHFPARPPSVRARRRPQKSPGHARLACPASKVCPSLRTFISSRSILSALLTISLSGAALHYFLPVLNPIVNVDVATSPLTAYLVCSGLYSGVSFYLRLMYAESPALNYPTFRIGWSTRLMLSLRQLVSTSFLNAQRSFKVFFIIWIGVTLVFSLQVHI